MSPTTAAGAPDTSGLAPAVAELLERAAAVAAGCAATAAEIDCDGAFPIEEFRRVAEAGLLAAPLPSTHGGLGLGTEVGGTLVALLLLEQLGRGNLSVGRLYEGHVNALQLIHTFGTPEQLAAYAADARDRRLLFGVWNTEPTDGVKIVPSDDGRYRLHGWKTFASGAGHVERALVTGAFPSGGWQMCVVPMDQVAVTIDPAWWRPIGMRASASYRVDFDGVELAAEALVGAPGDYFREPWFSGGAIRFAAAQLGGARALFDATRDELRASGRADDPHQRARVGEAAIAIESGNLWLRGAADVVDRSAAWHERGDGDAEAVVAYAHMTRLAIETICLDLIRLAERSVGARGLLRPHPIERIVRDLTLYLRQPAPDAALATVGRHALEGGEPWPDRA